MALRSRYVFGQEEDCIFPPDRANVLGEVFCVKVENSSTHQVQGSLQAEAQVLPKNIDVFLFFLDRVQCSY